MNKKCSSCTESITTMPPPSFLNVWPKNIYRDLSHELRNEDNFELPRPRFEGFKKYPLYTFAKTRNESGDLRLYSNLTTFKIALRNQLLVQLDPDE